MREAREKKIALTRVAKSRLRPLSRTDTIAVDGSGTSQAGGGDLEGSEETGAIQKIIRQGTQRIFTSVLTGGQKGTQKMFSGVKQSLMLSLDTKLFDFHRTISRPTPSCMSREKSGSFRQPPDYCRHQ